MKRLFDIVFSLTFLVLCSPLILVAAAGIKLTSAGPVIFKQDRVGLNGGLFRIYKLRTMFQQPQIKSDREWVIERNPRTSKFGAILRRTNLDELPQFVNVLMGQMSVIGPRPERPYFVKKFMKTIPEYTKRHQMRPGITGLAQIYGFRGDTSIEDRSKLDLYYIEHWTHTLDLMILWRTVILRSISVPDNQISIGLQKRRVK